MRRVIRRVAAMTLGALLAVFGLGAAWLNGWNLPGASGATAVKITKLQANTSGLAADQPIFVMFVGSDLRPGVGGARGDALHLVAINQSLHAGTIINIPRDTCNGRKKINESNSKGGVANTASVVGAMMGITIPYGVEVDFAGFSGLIDDVGGVYIDVPMQMSDKFSGAFFPAGPQKFSGAQALAYSRNRHDFARSDIQRSWNQGHLMVEAIKQLQQQYSTISGRFKLVEVLYRNAKVSGMGAGELVQLGQAATEVPAANFKNVTLPTTGGGCLGLAAAAQTLFNDIRDNGVLDQYPSGVATLPDPRP